MGQISSSHFYASAGLSFFGILSFSVCAYVLHKICTKNSKCKSKHMYKESHTDIEAQKKVDAKNTKGCAVTDEKVSTLSIVKETSKSREKELIPVSTKDAESQSIEKANQATVEKESVNEDHRKSKKSTKRTDPNIMECACVCSKESSPPDTILQELKPYRGKHIDDLNTSASVETQTTNKDSDTTEDSEAEALENPTQITAQSTALGKIVQVSKAEKRKQTVILTKHEEIEEPNSEEKEEKEIKEEEEEDDDDDDDDDEEEEVILVFAMETELSDESSVVLNVDSKNRRKSSLREQDSANSKQQKNPESLLSYLSESSLDSLMDNIRNTTEGFQTGKASLDKKILTVKQQKNPESLLSCLSESSLDSLMDNIRNTTEGFQTGKASLDKKILTVKSVKDLSYLELSSDTSDQEISETEEFSDKTLISNDRKLMKKKTEKTHKCPSCERFFIDKNAARNHYYRIHKHESKENSMFASDFTEEKECSTITEDEEMSETEEFSDNVQNETKMTLRSNDKKSMKKKSEKTHKCPSCQRFFKDENGVKTHFHSIHRMDSKEFAPSLSSTRNSLPLHTVEIETEHDATIDENLRLSRQKSFQKSQKSLLCPEQICDARLKTPNGLKMHLETKHNKSVESDTE